MSKRQKVEDLDSSSSDEIVDEDIDWNSQDKHQITADVQR